MNRTGAVLLFVLGANTAAAQAPLDDPSSSNDSLEPVQEDSTSPSTVADVEPEEEPEIAPVPADPEPPVPAPATDNAREAEASPVPAIPPSQVEPEVPATSHQDAPAPALPTESEVQPPSSDRVWLALSGHLSLLGDLVDRSTLLVRGGYALLGGYRFGDFGVFGLVEHDVWLATEVDLGVELGVLNVAAGFEWFYVARRVRASVALGIATLLEDQPFHGAGRTGLFFELRPVGLRWPVGEHWTVQIDPLAFAVEAPVIGSPSLVDVEYRFALTLEWQS